MKKTKKYNKGKKNKLKKKKLTKIQSTSSDDRWNTTSP